MIKLKKLLERNSVKIEKLDDTFTAHMKVIKSGHGGQAEADFHKLERAVSKTKDRLIIRKFQEFKKARKKAGYAGSILTRAINMQKDVWNR